MKLRVLAVDFDGTIAVDGRLDSDVASALEQARNAGVLTVLVTGRILEDLDRLLPSPAPFDAIVAENGAVFRLSGEPEHNVLSRRVDRRLLQELALREIDHRSGACVVEAAADAAPRILEIIQRLGLPLAISFNRGRLMVLPHGVTKGSGVRNAFWRLRVSAHNAAAIGDAENDRTRRRLSGRWSKSSRTPN